MAVSSINNANMHAREYIIAAAIIIISEHTHTHTLSLSLSLSTLDSRFWMEASTLANIPGIMPHQHRRARGVVFFHDSEWAGG